MTNETLDTWLGTVLAQAREQKNHAVVEFLVENIHRRQPLTAQTLIWLAEAQINLLKYKEVWNTVQEILKLDPTDPAARAFRDTIERVASTYVIDGQSRRVGIIDAADFIVAHPTRGKSIPIATLQQADRERSLRVHELYDVMVVGGEGMIFDATTTSVFRNSFASKEHVNVDVMTLERNLRLNTSECVQILGPAVHLCGQWSGNFFHWMSDLLPRVQLLHNRGFDGRYLIPFANHPFIRESFELMGINSERLIQYDPRFGV
jgi:hypothetical protein